MRPECPSPTKYRVNLNGAGDKDEGRAGMRNIQTFVRRPRFARFEKAVKSFPPALTSHFARQVSVERRRAPDRPRAG
jgi:hypothetical protein